jgi:hypothetical protein
MTIVVIIFIVVIGIVIILYISGSGNYKKEQDSNNRAIETASSFTADFTTPEGAILCLENAYKNKDINTAIKCKDFKIEAKLMLQKLNNSLDNDPEVVNKTAETLELSFKKFTTASWPDFKGIKSHFVSKEPHSDKIMIITEIFKYPDGSTSKQKILVAETPIGWRVLNPL